MYINPGRFKHLISFNTKNNDGTLTKVFETKADIFDIRGTRNYQANATNYTYEFEIRIRYRTDVNPRMIIQYGNRKFAFSESPINIEMKNQVLQFNCSEVV